MFKLFFSLVTLCFLLTSCGAEEKTSKDDERDTPLESLLDTQLDALDKAKSVEDSLQNDVDEREKRMREQGI